MMAVDKPILLLNVPQVPSSPIKQSRTSGQPQYPHIVVDGIELKWCGSGSHYAALSEFNPRPSRWDGLQSTCKACHITYAAQWQHDHQEENKVRCRAYYEDHKDEVNEANRAYREANLEVSRERERNYVREHREEKRVYKHAYRIKHQKKLNEIARDNYQRYKKERPEILRAQRKLADTRRRARIKGLPFDFTEDDAAFAFAYTNSSCFICGAQEGLWNTLALDHWWPLAGKDRPSLGTVVENIIVLCHVGGRNKAGKIDEIGGCNNSKGHGNPEQWLLEKLGTKQAKKKLKEIEQFFQAAIADARRRKEHTDEMDDMGRDGESPTLF